MTPDDIILLMSVMVSAAGGAAGAVWWMFSRELSRIHETLRENREDNLRDITRVEGMASRAHVRLDEMLTRRN